MWKYWSGGSVSHTSDQTFAVELPAGCEQFSGEVETWISEQCASLGIGTLVKLRSVKTLKRPLSANAARKIMKDDNKNPTETQSQLDSSNETITPESTPQQQQTDVGNNICVRVRIDKKLTSELEKQNSHLRSGISSHAGASGTIGDRYPIAVECGAVRRYNYSYSRCLYRVRLSRSDLLVPAAFLKKESTATSSTTTCDLYSDNEAVVLAAEVAASKIRIFDLTSHHFTHLSNLSSDLRELCYAARELFPDTAVFYRRRRYKKGSIITFCACGVGASYVQEWLPTAVVLQKKMPQGGLSLRYIGSKNGCGIHYDDYVTEIRKPVWEYRKRESESKSWTSFVPSDSHLIEFITRHRGKLTTPLSQSPGSLYVINACNKTMKHVQSSETLLYDIRKVNPEILVSDVRVGDVVRMRRDNTCGEVLSINQKDRTCNIALSGNGNNSDILPWSSLEVVDLRSLQFEQTQLNNSSNDGPKLYFFGSSSAVAAAVSRCNDISETYQITIPTTAPVAMKCAEKLQLLLEPLQKPEQLDVYSDHLVVTSTVKQSEAIIELVRYCFQKYQQNYQQYHLGLVFSEIRKQLSRVKKSFIKHQGFSDAEAAESCFQTVSCVDKKTVIDQKLEDPDEEALQQISLMWTTLDDYSTGLLRQFNSPFCFQTSDWNLANTLLGIHPGTTVTLLPDSVSDNNIQIGDEVRIRPSSYKSTYRYSSISDTSIGIVLSSSDGSCSVAFKGNSSWRGCSSDLERVERSQKGVFMKAIICLQYESSDGGNPTIKAFSKAMRKWVSSVIKGHPETGYPSCLSVDVDVVGQRRHTTLLCPTSKRLHPSDQSTNVYGDEYNSRCYDVIFTLVRLKYISLCETILVQNLSTQISHCDDYDSVTRAEEKIKLLIENCSQSMSGLRQEVEVLLSEAKSFSETEVPQSLTIHDVESDKDKVFHVREQKLYFENLPVSEIDFDIDSNILRVKLDTTKACIPMCSDIRRFKLLSKLCKETNTRAPFFDRFVSVDVNFLLLKLEKQISFLKNEWRDSLTSVLFDIRRTRQDLKALKLQSNFTRFDIFKFKQRLSSTNRSVIINWDDCTVEGLPLEVSEVMKMLNNKMNDFGSENSLICEISNETEKGITSDCGLVAAAVSAACGVENIKIESNNGFRAAELKLVGSKGELTNAMNILNISYNSDTVFRSGPDVRGQPDIKPIQCCSVESSPRMLLSCGHHIHKECVSTLKGLRCPLCYELLRLPEIRTFGCPGVLQQLHIQCEAAFEQDGRLKKCDCGEWAFVPPDHSETVICSSCSTIVRMNSNPTCLRGSQSPLCSVCKEPTDVGYQCGVCMSYVVCTSCPLSSCCGTAFSLKKVVFRSQVDPSVNSNHLAHTCSKCGCCSSFLNVVDDVDPVPDFIPLENRMWDDLKTNTPKVLTSSSKRTHRQRDLSFLSLVADRAVSPKKRSIPEGQLSFLFNC